MIRLTWIVGVTVSLVLLASGLKPCVSFMLERYFVESEKQIAAEKTEQMMQEGAETTAELVRLRLVTVR